MRSSCVRIARKRPRREVAVEMASATRASILIHRYYNNRRSEPFPAARWSRPRWMKGLPRGEQQRFFPSRGQTDTPRVITVISTGVISFSFSFPFFFFFLFSSRADRQLQSFDFIRTTGKPRAMFAGRATITRRDRPTILSWIRVTRHSSFLPTLGFSILFTLERNEISVRHCFSYFCSCLR